MRIKKHLEWFTSPVKIEFLTRSKILYGILTLAIQAKFSNLEAGYKIGDPKKIIVVSRGTISAKSLIKQPINEK